MRARFDGVCADWRLRWKQCRGWRWALGGRRLGDVANASGSLNHSRIPGWRTTDQVLEIADEVGLIGVPEVEREGGEVGREIGGEALGGFDEPIALDDPLRRHADVLA